ncbi:MAG TPA: IS481 family transposase [Gemmatimonadaceae bacterium]
MPWPTPSPMSQRLEFIQAVLHRKAPQSIKDVAAQFGVSEKTAHKWLTRFERGGPEALGDRSRAPHVPPHQVAPAQQAAICALRQAHPTWGARKLLSVLQTDRPAERWPAPSTITRVLKRHDLVAPRARHARDRAGWATTHLTAPTGPNDVWAADFKGQFRVGSGEYCYPLTVTDLHARYLVGVEVQRSVASEPAEAAFQQLFATYGLPRVIRTDNGVPFGLPGALGGLSRLAVWWVRLGIRPERIRKGHPQDNGAHERMHRTLKAETTRPAAATLAAQQARLRAWQATYNDTRPHEALGQTPPARHYAPSSRPLPRRLPPVEYPAHYELREVSSCGTISWRGVPLFLSKVLTGEYVGLYESAEGVWTVTYGPLTLGTYDESLMQFLDSVSWTAPV